MVGQRLQGPSGASIGAFGVDFLGFFGSCLRSLRIPRFLRMYGTKYTLLACLRSALRSFRCCFLSSLAIRPLFSGAVRFGEVFLWIVLASNCRLSPFPPRRGGLLGPLWAPSAPSSRPVWTVLRALLGLHAIWAHLFQLSSTKYWDARRCRFSSFLDVRLLLSGAVPFGEVFFGLVGASNYPMPPLPPPGGRLLGNLWAPSVPSIRALWSVFRPLPRLPAIFAHLFQFSKMYGTKHAFFVDQRQTLLLFCVLADRSPMLPSKVHLGGGIFVDSVCVPLLSSSVTVVWGIMACLQASSAPSLKDFA